MDLRAKTYKPSTLSMLRFRGSSFLYPMRSRAASALFAWEVILSLLDDEFYKAMHWSN